VKWAAIGVIASTLVIVGLQPQSGVKSGRFARPTILWDEQNDRAKTQPAWLRLDWTAKADEPFQAIHMELAPYRVFSGFDTRGEWAKKTMTAYNDWIRDPQNAVKLYRVSAYFGILGGLDNASARTPEFTERWSDVQWGWMTIKSGPPSRLFVRQGYRCSAGNGFRTRYGDLCQKLLKHDPLDRAVLFAGIAELSAERMQWSKAKNRMYQLPGKGLEFEEFLLKACERIRKSDQWRPWDGEQISNIHAVRAWRTRKKSDLRKAIELLEASIKVTPAAHFDVKRLQEHVKFLTSMLQYMQND
jgi:hypothetical protein